MSVFFYSIAIGTLDGKDQGKYHTPSAILFFIIWLYVVIDVTIFLTKMKIWDSSVMSHKSIIAKQLLAIYVIVLWVYCLYGVNTSSSGFKYVVIV